MSVTSCESDTISAIGIAKPSTTAMISCLCVLMNVDWPSLISKSFASRRAVSRSAHYSPGILAPDWNAAIEWTVAKAVRKMHGGRP
jgi:hypothetical protein